MIVEGDLFLSARSSFFFLSSFFLLSFFFSHPESCLKIEILGRKSDVLGRPREGGPGGNEKNEKNEK